MSTPTYTKRPDGAAILDTPEKLLEYTRRVLHREPTPELLRFEPLNDNTVWLYEGVTYLGRADSIAVDSLRKLAEKHPPVNIVEYSMRNVAPTSENSHNRDISDVDKPYPLLIHVLIYTAFWLIIGAAAGIALSLLIRS